MEEKKKKTTKKVDTKDAQEEPKQRQLSYEELTNVANQLSNQNRQLRQQLGQMNMTNIFRRLDYLFKVVENGHMFSEKFLNECTDEIEETLAIPKKEEEEEEEEEEGEEGNS